MAEKKEEVKEKEIPKEKEGSPNPKEEEKVSGKKRANSEDSKDNEDSV